MEKAQPIDFDLSSMERHRLPVYRRLGLVNGLLIGAAVALGAWGGEAWRVAQLPVTITLPSLALGFALIIALCGLTGWLTSRIHRTPITFILWVAAAIISMLIMGYLPYYGRTLTVWLADARFWGRDVFPYVLEASPAGMIVGGLLIILTLGILGLLQGYRLENITLEASHRGRLNGRVWASLLLPLPLVFLASLVTQGVISNPAPTALEVTHRAITVAQDYEGDLREFDAGDGISYAALRPVQELIDSEFTLSIVDINPLISTVIVEADFANGAWVYCRIINDQLSFCYDASPPYTIGLVSLVTGEPLPENCRGCALQATDGATGWLAAHRGQLGSDPGVERVVQQGSHVLMRLTGDGGFTAECWIEGVAPPQLTECQEVNP